MAASSATAEASTRRRSALPWANIGIFLVLLIAGIAAARSFLVPVVFGFLLALIFSPVRRFFERRGIPAVLSAITIVGMLIAALLAGLVILAEPVSTWLADAPSIGREVESKLRNLLGSAKAVMEASQQVNEIASAGQETDAQEVVVREPGMLADMAFRAPAVLAQAAFTMVLLLFLLASGDLIYEKLVRVMPTFRDKRKAISIAYDIERNLSRYFFTITVINTGLGIAIGTAMWLIGLPNPVLFGVLGFALNYVPYLGAATGVALVSFVGLITFDNLGNALLPGAVYFALNAFESQLVTPFFVGRRLEIPPVIIFLSIAFWAWLWSVLGMLVAVPLLVTFKAFCQHIPKLQPVGEFLSHRGDEKDTDSTAGPETAPGSSGIERGASTHDG